MSILTYEKNHRKAIISKMDDGRYYIIFKYDGYLDYEWKKGSHGVYCDVCDTLQSAKGKARRYINK
mgnify:CR=1 FL=1